MDKFDDYLEKESKNENEKFTLPKSFDNKIEETLLNLDKENKKENNEWYLNKRVWTTAACFAFICLAGFGLTNRSNLENMMSRSKMDSGQEITMQSSVRENNDAQRSAYENSAEIHESNESAIYDEVENYNESSENDIYSINIEVLNSFPKYKEITDKDDINKIKSLINSIPLYEEINGDINDWKYSVRVYGKINHVYSFVDNLVSIDGVVYKTSEDKINELDKLYDTLKYEENSLN